MYERFPGEVREVFNKFDLLNLPHPKNEINKEALKDKIHVLDFVFDDPGKVANNPAGNGDGPKLPCAGL